MTSRRISKTSIDREKVKQRKTLCGPNSMHFVFFLSSSCLDILKELNFQNFLFSGVTRNTTYFLIRALLPYSVGVLCLVTSPPYTNLFHCFMLIEIFPALFCTHCLLFNALFIASFQDFHDLPLPFFFSFSFPYYIYSHTTPAILFSNILTMWHSQL